MNIRPFSYKCFVMPPPLPSPPLPKKTSSWSLPFHLCIKFVPLLCSINSSASAIDFVFSTNFCYSQAVFLLLQLSLHLLHRIIYALHSSASSSLLSFFSCKGVQEHTVIIFQHVYLINDQR